MSVNSNRKQTPKHLDMSDIFLVLVLVLFALAILDLVVGVSNDAVNFLNSAIGSRVAPRHIIMLVASLGIFVGAGFSSGMMEVARKGIFNPEHFFFAEIMIIFAAVMLTDILLLDLFNTFGLPTSTTVSIVFELLGAAVVISMIKIAQAGESLTVLGEYINTSQALAIISGIFLSIAIAFTVGTLVQYFSRLLFSFQYTQRLKYVGALWAGVALSALTYFLLIKGMKGAAFIPEATMEWVSTHTWTILVFSFVSWSVLLQVLISVWQVNILRIVVLFGTFALAMAFAGNDLVNFIGVPLAGFDAFTHWSGSGIPADQLSMESLNQPVRTHTFLLLIAGAIMILTLWFSKKARSVTETEVNLGRQNEGAERFSPNLLSRSIVRAARNLGRIAIILLPHAWIGKAERHFEPVKSGQQPESERPAFDLVRASVNLTVASMLISLATSYKLPLSTTYVSFMVAMGTSLADRAWGRDSAVYRVAGVLQVVAGWFFTALIAFSVAGTFAFLIHSFGIWAIGSLLLLVGVFIFRSFRFHRQKEQQAVHTQAFAQQTEMLKRPAVHQATRQHISNSLQAVRMIYRKSITGLLAEDRMPFQEAKHHLSELHTQNSLLKDQLFRLIQRIEEEEAENSRLYVLVYDLEQDLLQSVQFIFEACEAHVVNIHSPLLPKQQNRLRKLEQHIHTYTDFVQKSLQQAKWHQYEESLQQKEALLKQIEDLLTEQISGIKSGQYTAKNSHVYFSILLETKDLVAITARFLKLYYRLPEYQRKAELVN